MEKACKAGKVRAIGLSNFYDARFVDLAENMEVKPAVVQLETHVFCQQAKMRELVKPYGIRIMAWSPLARGMNGLFGNNLAGHCRPARQGHCADLPEVSDGRRNRRHSPVHTEGAHGKQSRHRRFRADG